MSLSINVEVIPGEDIESACKSAVDLAEKLGVMVCFDFNGFHLCAVGISSPDILVEEYLDRSRKRRD